MKVLVFQMLHEVVTAYQCEQVDLHAQIKVRLVDNEIVETTVGRVIIV